MLDALAPDCDILEGPARLVKHVYASSGLWLTLAGFQSMHLSLQKGTRLSVTSVMFKSELIRLWHITSYLACEYLHHLQATSLS